MAIDIFLRIDKIIIRLMIGQNDQKQVRRKQI